MSKDNFEGRVDQGDLSKEKKDRDLLATVIEWAEKAKAANEAKFNSITPSESSVGFADFLIEEAGKGGKTVELSAEDIAKGFELMDMYMRQLSEKELEAEMDDMARDYE